MNSYVKMSIELDQVFWSKDRAAAHPSGQKKCGKEHNHRSTVFYRFGKPGRFFWYPEGEFYGYWPKKMMNDLKKQGKTKCPLCNKGFFIASADIPIEKQRQFFWA